MARTSTPVEPDENENDTEFSGYMERLLPGCQSLKELIQAEIKKALQSSSNPNMTDHLPDDRSGSYLERQNAMLLAQLLKSEGRTRSVSIPLPANEPPGESFPRAPPAPKAEGPKTAPFGKGGNPFPPPPPAAPAAPETIKQ